MKSRVYLNRVQTNYQSDFAKAKDYFKRHGVDINFEFVQSDYKNLSFIKRMLPQGERVSLQPYMANIVPIDPTYDFTCFMFNQAEFTPPNLPTGSCYLPAKQPFIDIGSHVNNPTDLTYVEICHEYMHALVMKANLAGFQVTDVMDTYYNNFFLDMEESNFGRQWKLLQPYINSLQQPENYFKTQEFVPKTIYQQYGENSNWFVDPRLKKLANVTRKFFNKPVTINNWHNGGQYNERGFREPGTGTGASLSQHRFGRAMDFTVAGMTPVQVYNTILANEKLFMDNGLTTMERIEDTPTWNHFDIRYTGLNKLLIVNG